MGRNTAGSPAAAAANDNRSGYRTRFRARDSRRRPSRASWGAVVTVVDMYTWWGEGGARFDGPTHAENVHPPEHRYAASAHGDMGGEGGGHSGNGRGGAGGALEAPREIAAAKCPFRPLSTIATPV